MSAREDIYAYLSKLGFNGQTIHTYLALSIEGLCTALHIATLTGISRTQVYRYIETLQRNNLVSAEHTSYGVIFRALPFENIETHISERQAELAAIRDETAAIAALARQLAGGGNKQAATTHYHGLAGIRQAAWNLTHATGECRIFASTPLVKMLGEPFASRFRDRLAEQPIDMFVLAHQTDIAHDIASFVAPSRRHCRRIERQALPLSDTAWIYDETVAFVEAGTTPYVMEIHHMRISAMLRTLHQTLWQDSAPLES